MHVLMIEDNEDDYLLISRQYMAKIADVQIEWCDTVDKGLAYLDSHSVDLLLLDLALPDSYGLAVLDNLQTRFPALPIIILSGDETEELGLEAVRHGAQDYLIKGRIDEVILGRSLRYALERKRLEERLRQSEELYRTFARNFPNGALILFDHDLRYTLVDGLGLSELGLSKERMEGKTLLEIFPPEIVAAGEPRLRAALAGETMSEEVVYAGQTLLVSYVPVRDSSGTVLFGMMTSQNITKRKRAEAAVQASETRFRLVAQNSPDLIYVLDLSQQRITFVNRTDFLGYSERELEIGAHVPAIHSNDQERFLDHWNKFLVNGELNGVGLIEYRIRDRGGEWHWIRSRQTTFASEEDGKLTQIMVTLTEITDRKQGEEALQHSEEQFRSAFTYAAIGMGLVALDGRWLQVNHALCGIIGYSERELMTKTFQDITHPDDLDSDLAYVGQILSGEIESYQMEKRYFHKLGHEVWVLLSVSLVRDRQGQPLHFISQLQDITPRKQAEAALAEERNLLRTLIDHMPDYIFVKDAAGRFVISNEAHTQASGKPVEEIIGKTSLEVFPHRLANQYYADDQRVIQSGQPVINAERRTPDPSGQEKWGLTSKVPLRDQYGRVTGLVGITRDITERKQVEQQALELAQERERVKILTDFVTDMSHDFRTPLSTINTSLYLMSKTTNPEKQKLSLVKAERQIARLTQLLDRLLIMAQLDSETAFAFQRIDLNRLIADFCVQLDYEAKEKSVTVVRSLCEGSLMIQAEPKELSLALVELGKNAVWYTPSDGTITIRTSRKDNQAVIEVCDTGIGIPTSEFSHIFQRLYRVDKARSSETGGSGLGLSIAKRIIELHQGNITVESVIGEGSIFRVFLPLRE
jgi:PAS domain S-box-containing protein